MSISKDNKLTVYNPTPYLENLSTNINKILSKYPNIFWKFIDKYNYKYFKILIIL